MTEAPSPALPDEPLPGQSAPGAAATPPEPAGGRLNRMWCNRPMWVRRVQAFFHLIRIRLARAVLLPQLTPDSAFDLRQTVRKEGQLTNGYILMCALAAGIATLGLLQSSTAVVIGAMLVSPLMSPIAALGFGFASLDGHRIRDAARVVAIGACIGIATGILLTWLSPIRNATPEILARTEPNLLDLAVALFSGIAGGYATVIGKGGTAIGVAIATALMPPLTVIGYGIGVLQPMFAMGALLLFLTNLAAITFAFALIARLSGAARPLGRVEWTPRYVAILIAAFLILATPLSMTLMKLSNEARIRTAARSAIMEACGGKDVTIAQLDVKSSVFGAPSVDALVIARSYTANADAQAQELLEHALGSDVQINLQQVLAADVQAQTRAMVDAAMERTAAGIAADVPPFKTIREAIGLPTHSLWTDRAQRMVYAEPMPAPGWTLADYRGQEAAVSNSISGWTVRLVPPTASSLTVLLGNASGGADGAKDAPPPPADAIAPDLAEWALARWGMNRVTLSGASANQLDELSKRLAAAGITATILPQPAETDDTGKRGAKPDPSVATIGIYPPSPSQVAAAKAASQTQQAAE